MSLVALWNGNAQLALLGRLLGVDVLYIPAVVLVKRSGFRCQKPPSRPM